MTEQKYVESLREIAVTLECTRTVAAIDAGANILSISKIFTREAPVQHAVKCLYEARNACFAYLYLLDRQPLGKWKVIQLRNTIIRAEDAEFALLAAKLATRVIDTGGWRADEPDEGTPYLRHPPEDFIEASACAINTSGNLFLAASFLAEVDIPERCSWIREKLFRRVIDSADDLYVRMLVEGRRNLPPEQFEELQRLSI